MRRWLLWLTWVVLLAVGAVSVLFYAAPRSLYQVVAMAAIVGLATWVPAPGRRK